MSGRQAHGVCVQSLDEDKILSIPYLIECDTIPGDRAEIPTPEVAQQHPHLRGLATKIPHIDPGADISLLIGRDLPDAHHVLDQVRGPPMTPFAQRLPLGWVIVGDVCLGKRHKPTNVNVNKTYITSERGTIFEPCPNVVHVSENERFEKIFEIYRHQWKHVQVLSNIFWKQRKEEYLQSLQQRRKWQVEKPNVNEGDLVLMKDAGTHRNVWPIGLVTRVFPSAKDTLVRSVEVRIIKDQEPVHYVRPISELVLL